MHAGPEIEVFSLPDLSTNGESGHAVLRLTDDLPDELMTQIGDGIGNEIQIGKDRYSTRGLFGDPNIRPQKLLLRKLDVV
ncbi:MAG: hypothetical protein M3Q44_00060 [bacterium]|nr:hypothetical protein [bacterium]